MSIEQHPTGDLAVPMPAHRHPGTPGADRLGCRAAAPPADPWAAPPTPCPARHRS